MSYKIEAADYVLLTIERANGEVNVVRHPKFNEINDMIFEKMKSMTLAANGNKLLSYQNVTKTEEVVLSERDLAHIELDKHQAKMKKVMGY